MLKITMEKTHVLYNGNSVVCRFEIGHYIEYARVNGLGIAFHDINTANLSRWGMTLADAQSNFHVIQNDQIHKGVPAFLVVWKMMPKYQRLARFVEQPFMLKPTTVLFDRVIMPVLHKWAIARENKALESSGLLR